MVRQAITLVLAHMHEYDDETDLAVYVGESMDFDPIPDWLFDLVSTVRIDANDDPDLLAGDAQRDSWIDDLCEEFEGIAA